MKKPILLIGIAVFLLFPTYVLMLAYSVDAQDTDGPEIHNTQIDPKYPQNQEEIAVFARVIDESSVSDVQLFYCIGDVCMIPLTMYDPDMDGIYDQTMGEFSNGTVIKYWVVAWDVLSNQNQTPEITFTVVSDITVGFLLEPTTAIVGNTVWANGTASYDGNESTLVEFSSVALKVVGASTQVLNTTDSEGRFNITFQAPDFNGSYEVNVTVTNRTLSSYKTASLTTNEPGDADGDGLNDEYENQIGTDPADPDTDGDGLNDDEEVFEGVDGYITDPLEADTDDDGLSDHEEVMGGEDGFETDPTNPDTDGDGTVDSKDWKPLDPDVHSPPRDDNSFWLILAAIIIVAIALTVVISKVFLTRRRENV